MLDVAESYAAIHHGVVAVAQRFDLVRLSGPDALSYLEGQVSQAVGDLGVGETAEALLLSPQGKIDAYLRCQRTAEQEVVLAVEEGYGSLVEERLRRFKIRVKADLELGAAEGLRVVGPEAAVRLAPGDRSASWPAGPFSFPLSWPGLVGFDLLGPPPEPFEIPDGDPAAFEAARIEAGLPAMASELVGGVIPQEAGGIVEHAVNFTKGCYTGQELVARLDARGNRVPKSLRGVVLPGEVGLEQVAVGSPLLVEEREVGRLTSLAFSPRTESVVALAYLRREVVPPAAVIVRDLAATHYSASILALPLWRE